MKNNSLTILFLATVLVSSGCTPNSPDSRAHTKELRAQLAAPDFETRRHAAIELSRAGDNSGVPILIEAMSTLTNQNDRNNCIVALRITKAPQSVPILIKATDDPSPYVRSIALEALGELAATDAYEAIVEHLHDYEAQEGSCIPGYPASAACYALGALGDKKAIPHLVEALEHKETQSSACQALAKLTGQQLHYDIAKWKQWWKKEKPNKRIQPTR